MTVNEFEELANVVLGFVLVGFVMTIVYVTLSSSDFRRRRYQLLHYMFIWPFPFTHCSHLHQIPYHLCSQHFHFYILHLNRSNHRSPDILNHLVGRHYRCHHHCCRCHHHLMCLDSLHHQSSHWHQMLFLPLHLNKLVDHLCRIHLFLWILYLPSSHCLSSCHCHCHHRHHPVTTTTNSIVLYLLLVHLLL